MNFLHRTLCDHSRLQFPQRTLLIVQNNYEMEIASWVLTLQKENRVPEKVTVLAAARGLPS